MESSTNIGLKENLKYSLDNIHALIILCMSINILRKNKYIHLYIHKYENTYYLL